MLLGFGNPSFSYSFPLPIYGLFFVSIFQTCRVPTVHSPYQYISFISSACQFMHRIIFAYMQFSDGCLDIILIKDCSKLALLSILLELNNGNHVKSPHVLYFKVSYRGCAILSINLCISSFFIQSQMVFAINGQSETTILLLQG